MIVPELFKYNSLISIPLFSAIALMLVRKTSDFSFRKHTVSKSIHFLNNSTYAIVFRINFIVKALLDLSFALYVLQLLQIPYYSLGSLALIASALLFGSLAYFIEGKYTFLHRVIVYTSGVLWAVGQMSVASSIGDISFILFTNIAASIPVLLAFGYLFARKTNVFFQAACISIWYFWLVIFVFGYL